MRRFCSDWIWWIVPLGAVFQGRPRYASAAVPADMFCKKSLKSGIDRNIAWNVRNLMRHVQVQSPVEYMLSNSRSHLSVYSKLDTTYC